MVATNSQYTHILNCMSENYIYEVSFDVSCISLLE
jgi:hypothetical protein